MAMTEQTADTIKALHSNRMEAYFVETKDEVVPFLADLLAPGDVVGIGGSVSLDECGVLEFLRNGDYEFLDREDKSLTPEDIGDIARDNFFADAFLTSCNAITEKGELYNIDGSGNRVAAITFGPKSVIIVVGENKIVANVHAAFARVKNTVAPRNAKRLSMKTPCAISGVCEDCSCDDRICCATTIHRHQRTKGRIKVIIVGEVLGY